MPILGAVSECSGESKYMEYPFFADSINLDMHAKCSDPTEYIPPNAAYGYRTAVKPLHTVVLCILTKKVSGFY